MTKISNANFTYNKRPCNFCADTSYDFARLPWDCPRERKQRPPAASHSPFSILNIAHFGKALDEVLAGEVKAYEPVLRKSCWLLLKRPEHLSDKQQPRLAELLQYNLESIRAYLLKEELQLLWGYVSPYWAGQFQDR